MYTHQAHSVEAFVKFHTSKIDPKIRTPGEKCDRQGKTNRKCRPAHENKVVGPDCVIVICHISYPAKKNVRGISKEGWKENHIKRLSDVVWNLDIKKERPFGNLFKNYT